MNRRLVVLAIAMALGVPVSAAAQDAASKQLAVRTELHTSPSLQLADEQFLKGDHGGKPVTVTGQLRIAQGAARTPVVVMIHGSGGMGPNLDFWTREFNEMGISTFALDCCTRRGPATGNTHPALLTRLHMA